MKYLDIVKFLGLWHDTAENYLVGETGGSMFLIEVLALDSLLYRNRLALKVRIDDYRTLLHIANILEVDVAAFIWEEVDLVGLVDSIAKGFMIVEGLLAVMSAETLSADVVSAFGIR